MLSELKNFTASMASIDELVEMSAQARVIEAEFLTLGVDLPAWFRLTVESLRREIRTKNADAVAAKIRDLELRHDALKTPSERREALEAEIARLKATQTAAV